MGKQMALFSPAPEDANERLNRSIAELRLQQMHRAETRPLGPNGRGRHHEKRVTSCPSCGARVTIER